MNKKIEIGDAIEVKKEHFDHLKILRDSEKSAYMVMKSGGEMYREAVNVLWEFVLKVYPELKEFHMTLKGGDKERPVILITGKR